MSNLPEGLSGRIVALAVGLLIYVVLRAVPIVGAIVTLAVILFGLGALSVWIWRAMRPGRTELSAES